VDEAGNQVGTAEKLAAHNEATPLHLAFSCYIFNAAGDFLMTQRAVSKKVWPGVWTNSCCGHPAPGESIEHAIHRRVEYELGMPIFDVQVILPKYRYTTPPFNGIIENEFCPVFIARTKEDPIPNLIEVESWKWISWDSYCSRATTDTDDEFSWWTKDQLAHIADNKQLLRYAGPSII
jgi:isopentenyl-diphosphate delta-isomerase